MSQGAHYVTSFVCIHICVQKSVVSLLAYAAAADASVSIGHHKHEVWSEYYSV